NDMIFDPEIWAAFSKEAVKQFPKGYTHLDRSLNLDTALDQLKKILLNKDGLSLSSHAFLPFLKLVIATPRYRYQETEFKYGLETKNRPISFASHFDALLLSFYSFYLSQKY